MTHCLHLFYQYLFSRPNFPRLSLSG
jgi:hypothetical protein